MPVKIVDIDSLHVASEMQPRQGRISIDTVEEYAEAIKSGAKFPPLVAFRVTDREYPNPAIVSGFHRIAAYRQAGVKRVEVEIREGTFREAWLAGWETNRTHGIRYTNSDKRHAAETALLLFPDESARSVADRLGVSDKLVGTIRKELIEAGKIAEPEQVRGSDGVHQSGKRKPTPTKNSPEKSNIQTTPVRTVRTGVVQASEQHESEPDATESTATPSANLPGKPDNSDKQTEPASAPVAEPQPAESKPATIVLPVHVDGWGIPIQPHAQEAFSAIPRFKELIAAVQHAAKLFNEVANLPGGIFLTLPDVSSYRRGKKLEDGSYADRFVHEGLEQALNHIKAATPTYTVCPYHYADTAHPDDCRCCRGKNWTPQLSTSTPKVCIERAQKAFGVTTEEDDSV